MRTGPQSFVLPIDKPEGPTSHDVVRMARGALGVRRVGHTGTLDPFASGLLLLCIGPATRLAEYLSGLDKVYEATALLGATTDTLDREGTVVATSDAWRDLDEARIREVAAGFEGHIQQVPPQYSAKKVRGVPMHRRARRGESHSLEPSSVTIHSSEVVNVELPRVALRLHCSSGTYVRAVARDLGERLGTFAHLVGLRRTAVGGFAVTDAIGPDDLKDADRVVRAALRPLEALAHLPRLEVGDETAKRLLQGQPVPSTAPAGTGGPVAVSHGGALLAVAVLESDRLCPRKVFSR